MWDDGKWYITGPPELDQGAFGQMASLQEELKSAEARAQLQTRKLMVAVDVLRFLGSEGDSRLAHETCEKIRNMK